MSYGKYIHEYQKGAVTGASPLQLVIMLYDGALRFMEAGKHAMLRQDIETQNRNLQKAQRIITELISCLDMAQGGEIATNLMGLYTYCHNQLVEANVYDKPGPIDLSIKILSDLRESWCELERQQKNDSHGERPLAA